jgi:hypothetical protein
VSGALLRPATPRTAVGERTRLDRLLAWRPTRRTLAVAGLVLLALVVLVVTAPPRTGSLDPAAVDPGGSRALANLLRDQGVTVVDVRRTDEAAAAAAGATVLVTDPFLPTPAMLDEVLAAGPRRVVLLEATPGSPALDRLAAGVEVADLAGDDAVAPACTLPEAEAAGDARLPGVRYDARAWSGTGAACYDRAERAGLVVLPATASRPEVVLLGSRAPLTNEDLDEAGNAALAMNLLGTTDRVAWWRPTLADPALVGAASASLRSLLPPWVLPVVVQLGIASLVVALWRGRRLGPLVVEPLPVVVRAGETAAGHGRLLHAQHARGEAAEHLRAAARTRAARRLGVAAGADPSGLVGAVATRTGRAPGAIGALLYGPEPADDAALVRLDHDLAELLGAIGMEVGGR